MLHNPETGLISIVYKGISAHRPVVIPIAPGIEIPLGPEKTLCKELIILIYKLLLLSIWNRYRFPDKPFSSSQYPLRFLFRPARSRPQLKIGRVYHAFFWNTIYFKLPDYS